MISGARALVESLERLKVRVVFGVPGGAVLPLYDSLLESNIRHVLARHEQQAAHMADGYARAGGRLGVCIATSGPGAMNLVTGLATAYMDSSPILAITGQVARHLIGRDAFQEADTVGVVTPITKYAFQARAAREIPSIIKTAAEVATTRRPGPVLVDVPVDVQRELADESEFDDGPYLAGYDPNPPELDRESVRRAAAALAEAERPLILAGGGVVASGAHEELRALAEMLGAPVATTLMGKGAFPEDHPLALGMIGMHGRPSANVAVNECDVLLAVGTRFSDRSTGKLDEFAKQALKIHIDVDSSEINKNVRVDVGITADAKEALSALLKELSRLAKRGASEAWRARLGGLREVLSTRSSGELDPPSVIKLIESTLDPGRLIVTTGVGQNQMWAALYFTAKHPRTFITSGGLGTMGFGLPAAIGAKVARPDKIVVDIDGDGSFLMTAQALATSVSENIQVIAVVLKNDALGMVRQWQHLFYARRFIATDFERSHDFVKLAEAFGAEGVRVESLGELERALRRAAGNEVTTVIEVPISREERVFPMVFPGRSLREVMIDERQRLLF
ncbi:MAG: biosynthetic-type acetolactate synthase large subunit [Fervidicoccaceae archaeon]